MFTNDAHKNGLIVVTIIYLAMFLTVGYCYMPEHCITAGMFTNVFVYGAACFLLVLIAIAVNHFCLAWKYGQFVVLITEIMIILSLTIIGYINVHFVINIDTL